MSSTDGSLMLSCGLSLKEIKEEQTATMTLGMNF
jgi:hypothetical protein